MPTGISVRQHSHPFWLFIEAGERPIPVFAVGAEVLDLAARELAGRDRVEAAERSRLIDLLGHDGDLPILNRGLCEAIRDGRITGSTPGLSQHLWASAMDKVSIEQPAFATYRGILGER